MEEPNDVGLRTCFHVERVAEVRELVTLLNLSYFLVAENLEEKDELLAFIRHELP